MPGLGTSADGDTLVGKDRADTVFAAIDAPDNILAIDAQATTLADFLDWQMRRLQFVDRCHSSQLDGVVFIGLAFDVLKQPGIFVGAACDNFDAVFPAEIADPTAGAAGLDYHEVRLVLNDQATEVLALSTDGLHRHCFGVCFVETHH